MIQSNEASIDEAKSGVTEEGAISGGDRYLSFSLGDEEYAMPLLSVKEVIAIPEITPIPFSPAHFLGIMNLRGQVISVIDLRQKLGIKPKVGTESAIIICDLISFSLGVVVDSINSVLSPHSSEIAKKPEIQSNKKTDYITNVYKKEGHLVLFLDIIKALSFEEQKILSKPAKQVAA